jgi:hypothetical protein
MFSLVSSSNEHISEHSAPSTSEDPAAEVVPFHGEMGTTIIETESCSTTSGAAEGGKGDAEPKEINQVRNPRRSIR